MTMWWDPTVTRGSAPPLNVSGALKNFAGPDARHLEGANFAFVDGHVKWMKYDNFDAPPASITPVTNWRLWYANAS